METRSDISSDTWHLNRLKISRASVLEILVLMAHYLIN